MTIIKLNGGLGNQMFQYAFGRNLAIKNNTELKLDISAFKNMPSQNTPRNYALGVFNINENIVISKELKKYKKSIAMKFFQKITDIFPGNYIYETKFNFNPKIAQLSKDAYLDGYWQTEKYFKNTENIIRNEFTLKNNMGEKALSAVSQINNTNSVSIHIRRGDYIVDKKTNAYHGSCTLDYYRKAVGIIKGKIDNPYFFIFSDDIPWVKNNLKIDCNVIFVSKEGMKDYEEMILMSKCKHNIIANSSFSWWGAWLNNNSKKIVIAPKKWFNNPRINIKDLIPKKWIKI